MSLVYVYSDPHIGLKRKQHYTPESLRNREAWCHGYLHSFLEDSRYDHKICLGDFFDKESNDEAAILRGLELAKMTDVILAGNHDVPNRASAASSLEVLRSVLDDTIAMDAPVSARFGNTQFYFAPHQLTNTQYQLDIDELAEEAKQFSGYRVLCLHCSYASPFELPESALHLSEARAIELLATFHHIWIGHEHKAADHFVDATYGPRLRIVSSLFPTSFDELDEGSHRALIYDAELGKVVKGVATPVLAVKELPASQAEAVDLNQYRYIELIDDLPPGEAQRAVVGLYAKGAFAVRLRTKEGAVEESTSIAPDKLISLPDLIKTALTESAPELVAVWDECCARR